MNSLYLHTEPSEQLDSHLHFTDANATLSQKKLELQLQARP
jgi:hypothetical protein